MKGSYSWGGFEFYFQKNRGVPNLTRPFALTVDSSDPSLEVLPLWHKDPSDGRHVLFINLLATDRGSAGPWWCQSQALFWGLFLPRSEQFLGNGSPGGGGVRRERKVGAGLWPAGEEPLLTRSVWPIEWPECDKCRFILLWKARDSTV